MAVLRILFCALGLGAALGAAAGPSIFVGTAASPLEHDAAVALQGYMRGLTGDWLAIEPVERVDNTASGVVLGTPESLPQLRETWPFGLDIPKHDGFLLVSLGTEQAPLTVVAATEPLGVRNGAMALAERAGAGLFIGQVVFPTGTRPFTKLGLGNLSESVSPLFVKRGMAAMHTHLMGAAAWEIADYQAYIEGLVRLRMNQYVVFAGADTPFAAFPEEDNWIGGERLATTARATWTGPEMMTSEFLAGSGVYFADSYFGAASSLLESDTDAFPAAQSLLANAFSYATGRGLETVLVVSVDGDPTEDTVQQRFASQLAHIAETYPTLDEIRIQLAVGAAAPCDPHVAHRSAWQRQADHWSEAFGGHGDLRGTQFALFGIEAAQVMAGANPRCHVTLDAEACSPGQLVGLRAVLPPSIQILDNHTALSIPLEDDGDLWMPQPRLEATQSAVADAQAAGASVLTATHWRVKEVSLTAGYLAALCWNPSLPRDTYVTSRAERYFPVVGEEAGQWVDELSSLGYRWVGGTGQQERYPFAWPQGVDRDRARLAQVALELRKRIGEKNILESILPEDILKGWLPERIPGISDALELTLQPTRALFGRVRTETPRGLSALYDRVAFVIALDYASTQLAAGPVLVPGERETHVLPWIEESHLGGALHLYGRRITTKGELGVVASINRRAWGSLIDQNDLGPDTVMQAASLQPDQFKSPSLRVLPGEVHVIGAASTTNTRITVRARSFESGKIYERLLKPTGTHTFALEFPEELPAVGAFEYAIEASIGNFSAIRWPEDSPDAWALAIRPTTAKFQPAETVNHQRDGLTVTATAVPERWAMTLEWDTGPGEVYSISRNGKLLGHTYHGWFEDTTPPSETTVTYGITATVIATGAQVSLSDAVMTPAFSDPEPMSDFTVGSRAGRIVLTWPCLAERAAAYRVTHLDATRNPLNRFDLTADLGKVLRVSSPVEDEGQSFRIQAITPDGSVLESGRRFGVRVADDALPPAFQLDSHAKDMMEHLGVLTQRGFTIGGPGTSLPTGAARWDRANGMTFNLWVRLEDTEGMPLLMCRGAIPDPDMALYLDRGIIHFYMAGMDPVCGTAIEPNRWVMLTATYAKGQIDLFVDGEPVSWGNAPRDSGTEGLWAPLAPPSALETRGLIDRVTFFEAALTSEEIAVIHHEEQSGLD